MPQFLQDVPDKDRLVSPRDTVWWSDKTVAPAVVRPAEHMTGRLCYIASVEQSDDTHRTGDRRMTQLLSFTNCHAKTALMQIMEVNPLPVRQLNNQ